MVISNNREQILELNSEQVNLQRTGYSNISEIAEIVVAGDTLAPAASVLNGAYTVPDGVKLEFTNPSTNSDGTVCVDLRWAKIQWGTATGVYTGNAVIAASAGTESTYIDSGTGTAIARFYVITAIDSSGNESVISNELSQTGGGSAIETSIPSDASGYVFDDTVGTEGVVIGDGILGIAFKTPGAAWTNFDHYRLYVQYSDDAGSNWYDMDDTVDLWTEIAPTNRIGYVHKGLVKTNEYRYKATIVAADGDESSALLPDKSKSDDSGHFPSADDNVLVVAELIFAENIVATNEVRGEHFYAQSYLAINDATFGNKGIQLQYNAGDPRAYIGDGGTNYLSFTTVGATGVLEVSGIMKIVSGSSGIGEFSDAGSLATLDEVGATNCDSTIISGGKIITGLLTASNITTGTLNASNVTVTNLSATNITAGTLSVDRIISDSLTEAKMSFFDGDGSIDVNGNGIYNCTSLLGDKDHNDIQALILSPGLSKLYGNSSSNYLAINTAAGLYVTNAITMTSSSSYVDITGSTGIYLKTAAMAEDLGVMDWEVGYHAFGAAHDGRIKVKLGDSEQWIKTWIY